MRSHCDMASAFHRRLSARSARRVALLSVQKAFSLAKSAGKHWRYSVMACSSTSTMRRWRSCRRCSSRSASIISRGGGATSCACSHVQTSWKFICGRGLLRRHAAASYARRPRARSEAEPEVVGPNLSVEAAVCALADAAVARRSPAVWRHGAVVFAATVEDALMTKRRTLCLGPHCIYMTEILMYKLREIDRDRDLLERLQEIRERRRDR